MSILNKIVKKDDKEVQESAKEVKTPKAEKKTGLKETPVHYFSIITHPHISEKAFDINAQGQYVFVVSDNANKTEIKKAIESFYKVKVSSVNIVSVPGKPKRYRGRVVIKSGFKKAVVTLKKGSTIDVMEAVK